MNNESLCCDQEHALLLQETGWMKDVEADGYFADKRFTDKYPMMPRKYITDTYRLDKILAKLPEWFWDKGLYYPGYLKRFRLPDEKCDELTSVVRGERFKLDDVYFQGQAAANAAAKLLHLLFKEGLVK